MDNKRRIYNAVGTYKLNLSYLFPVAAGNLINSRPSTIDALSRTTYNTAAGVAFLIYIIYILKINLIILY
jgi:hypothetical protein